MSGLKAGRELDARVHAAVWKREVVMMSGQAYSRSREGSWETLTIIPEYSTDVSAASEVLMRFGFDARDKQIAEAFALTLPLAVCIAALKTASPDSASPVVVAPPEKK